MDPTACLQRIIDACEEGNSIEAYFACKDLMRWLRKGGSLPDVTELTITDKE